MYQGRGMIYKKSLLFFVLTSLIFLLPSCWPGKTAKTAEKIQDFAIVNVLDKELYEDCHIKGSISVPFDVVREKIEKLVDKGAEVVTYCTNYMCGASSAVRKELIKMGYKKVYVYEGGTAEWKAKGYPCVGPCKKGYLGTVGTPPEKQESYMLTAEQLKAKIDAYAAKK